MHTDPGRGGARPAGTPSLSGMRLAGRAITTVRPWWGLAAVVVAFAAIASLYAFEQPPFVAPDESAHVGYAHEIAHLRLPEITTVPDVPSDATQWIAERTSAKDDRYRGVWVANHPPLHYALEAPLVWLSDALGRADGGLLFLRLANVLFAAVGVLLTYFLAFELSGGLRRIALASAALVAFAPQAHAVFSQGLNDGLGFAAGTALVWAALRWLRTNARRDLIVLGGAGAAAFGARASTMLLAVAVVGLLACFTLVRSGARWRDRVRDALVVTAVGLGPGAVLFGWFYVRNIVVYGDIGASNFLFEMFRRRRRGSVLEMVTMGYRWVDMYHSLLSPSTLRRIWPRALTVVTWLAAAGLVVVAVTGRTGDRTSTGERGRVDRRGLLLCAIAVALIALTVAQHLAGGGNGYARYFFPVLGVLATFVVLGLDRLVPRVLPTAAVVALAWWALTNIPTAVDPHRVRRPRDRGAPAPALLQVLPGNDTLRLLIAIMIGAATVAVLAAIALTVAMVRSGRRASRD